MRDIVLQAFLILVPMILSLTVHEFAHAWTAKKFGDNTAAFAGRLTLNPMAHADPMGTIILPMLIMVANGTMFSGHGGGLPFFGWAKPVPVDPRNFRRHVSVRVGSMLVAAAGPAANLLMAFCCALIYSMAVHRGWIGAVPESMQSLLSTMLRVNIGLFVFNMIPIYPLDGQKVVSGLLSRGAAQAFERFNGQFGSTLLLLLVFVAHDILAYPVYWVSRGVLAAVGLG